MLWTNDSYHEALLGAHWWTSTCFRYKLGFSGDENQFFARHYADEAPGLRYVK